MDGKSIRRIIGLFSCLLIVGVLTTFINKSILKTKREELYNVHSSKSSNETDDTKNTEPNISESSGSGPLGNRISEEKYWDNIAMIENQIKDVWDNVSDSSGNSANSAAKYEKGVWEKEYVNIFNLYVNRLSSDAAEKAMQEKTSFESEREKKSVAAAKNANEALDGLAYNKEYIKLTKEKVYKYIELYYDSN